jgi:CRP-like cAMP-binding protein
MAKRTVSDAKVRALLKDVPLLSSCSRRELSVLAGIVTEHHYKRGEVVFEKGDPADGLHLVVEGTARVKIGNRTRRRLEEGSFFGELALLDGEPRSATVVADSKLTTLLLPRWSFNAVLRSQPRMAVKMLKEVGHRLRTVTLAR